MSTLKYLSNYSEQVKAQVLKLVEQEKLADYLLKKYPTTHQLVNDKSLREYAVSIKNQYIKN